LFFTTCLSSPTNVHDPMNSSVDRSWRTNQNRRLLPAYPRVTLHFMIVREFEACPLAEASLTTSVLPPAAASRPTSCVDPHVFS
jgi:hypothetical protein